MALLSKGRTPPFEIITSKGPASQGLRSRARAVPTDISIQTVARRMEQTMNQAGGVGIAGPQVGLNVRVACLKLDYKEKNSNIIFVMNPVILERSHSAEEGYEGCLSIPGVGGMVRRNTWLRLRYNDMSGKSIETEASGYNAVLWQHELDHLDGILYVDKLLGDLLPMDEVRRLRKDKEREQLKTNNPNKAARDSHLQGGGKSLMVAML